MPAMRQITFRIDPQLWKAFTIRCVEKNTDKTKVLVDKIKEFLKER